ncbi:MAG TPA: hypothetical protein VEC36_13710 [Patescibacteria group bacterium]|nr:hypothetical protein [Patescibacteria group bacterium]
MYSKILNYGIRILMILMGFLMVFGVFTQPRQDPSLMRMMGIVLILFGIYRIAIYHTRQQRRHRDGEKENHF